MKKLIGALAAFFVFISGAIFAAAPTQAATAAPIDVGAAAPDFTTQGALAGKTFDFSLADHLKKGPVVLYFFPKVFTQGCTAEAHEFAEKTEEFNKAGAVVIGLSADKIDEVTKFSVDECRSKFTVGVASPAIIKAYNVPIEAKYAAMPGMANASNRTTFVIGTDGKIKMRFSDLDYRQHVSKSLEAVKALAPKK